MNWFRYGQPEHQWYVNLDRVLEIEHYKDRGKEYLRLWADTGDEKLSDIAQITEPADIEELLRRLNG